MLNKIITKNINAILAIILFDCKKSLLASPKLAGDAYSLIDDDTVFLKPETESATDAYTFEAAPDIF